MSLWEMPYLQSVAEREIDFLLLEEFHSEPEFVTWFASYVTGKPLEVLSPLGAWHSISDSNGESDLVLLVGIGETKHAILIENKVNALPQPAQGRRYFIRGEAGKSAGDWHSFSTCIIATENYLETNGDAATYDARLGYEEIREWIRRHLPPTKRTEWKIMLLTEAIEQNRRGRKTVLDERVTAFFRDYWQFARDQFPELGIYQKKNEPAGGAWFQEFRPEHLESKYRDFKIYHEFPDSAEKHRVYIYFPGLQPHFQQLVDENGFIATDSIRFVPVGKQSVGLAIRVPSVRPTERLTDQTIQVRAALKAVYRLSILLPFVKLPK